MYKVYMYKNNTNYIMKPRLCKGFKGQQNLNKGAECEHSDRSTSK